MNSTAAKAELWRRYDAGDVTAEEVEARLVLLERAPEGDERAVQAAIDAPIPVHRRRSTRRLAVAALLALAAAGSVGGIVTLASAMSDGDGASGSDSDGFERTGVATVVPGPAVGVGRDVVVAVPAPPAPVLTTVETAVETTDASVGDAGG